MYALSDFEVIENIVSCVLMFGVSEGGYMSSGRNLFCSIGLEVDCKPCFSCIKCPLIVGIVGDKCFVMRDVVRPGHSRKLLFFIAFRKVSLVGEKHVAWRYNAKSFLSNDDINGWCSIHTSI